MAYVVGSLSDLISGSNSASKESNVKIVFEKKQIAVKHVKVNKQTANELVDSNTKKKRKNSHRGEGGSSDSFPNFIPDRSPRKRFKPQETQSEETQGDSNHVLNKEKESRTVIVKNVPNKLKKSKLSKIFREFGVIESVRFRCPPLSDPRVSKKVAIIKGKFHPDRSNIIAFVCFKSVDSANKALVANGTLVGDHHILVDKALQTYQHDSKKAVFIGNCPFSAEEDDLWKLFEKCGKISDIRIIRDRKTGIGKGFAYVNFESTDAVELALNLNGEELKDRQIRVSRISGKRNTHKPEEIKNAVPQAKPKKPKKQKPKHEKRKREQMLNMLTEEKKVIEEDGIVRTEIEHHVMKSEIKKESTKKSNSVDSVSKKPPRHQNKTEFQGQKTADKKKKEKKKRKINKEALKKKILIKKLAVKKQPLSKKVKVKLRVTVET